MAEDLSQHHQPVSDLFPWPVSPEERHEFRLSDQNVEFFHEHGYVNGVRILDEAQVDRLHQELSTLLTPEHDGFELWHEYHSNESVDPDLVLFHALGAWRIRPGFHDLIWHPAFSVPASQLLGGSVRFWHDQLFCKPARHGGVVAWHQDYSYWTRTTPMAHLTCWIALDDSDSRNGCLNYVPGSHRWDLLPITGLAGDMDAIRNVLTDEQWDRLQNPVSVELKRGEATFHHPLMVHGSRENLTDRPRRATVINVLRDGVESATDEPLMQQIPPVPSGCRVEGQFFPMILELDGTSVEPVG